MLKNSKSTEKEEQLNQTNFEFKKDRENVVEIQNLIMQI